MEQTWALKVERFGKIKQGEIDIAPLMLFVGDNNSGKSYLMSLLWGGVVRGAQVVSKRPSEHVHVQGNRSLS
ncbi:AAA family ATPase [Geobacillus stearothermophilus]|uniref:AAA family ATPase n=1 Tax=Geobacillus stearothermophilus TaxID=1422 RepID=UPI002E23FAB8|nr:AAA family ATPase [Geobacillus stearothermophilus]MED4987010.1 AAA family ATPase [Geobacillus stearothermophilus]